MAVLVERLTLVLREEALRSCGPLRWGALRFAGRYGSVVRRGGLVAICGLDRERLRHCLAGLGALGLAEAWTLLATTDRPRRRETRAESAARRAAQAGTGAIALVHRLQRARPEWLAVGSGKAVDGRRIDFAWLWRADAPASGARPREVGVPPAWAPRSRKARTAGAAPAVIRTLAAPVYRRTPPPRPPDLDSCRIWWPDSR